MADFNAFRDKALGTLNTVVDKTREIAGTVADKAKDTAQIAKLNLEISSEREQVKKAYLEIGKLYYETHKTDPDSFFTQLCEEVSLSLDHITALEAEIARLKAGTDAADKDDIDVEFEVIVEAEDEDTTCGCGCSCEKSEDEAPTEES